MTIATFVTGALTSIMIVFLVINSFHALLLMLSVPEVWSGWQFGDDEYFRALVGPEALPPISPIIPSPFNLYIAAWPT